MKDVEDFLLKNGFKKHNRGQFSTDKCGIIIADNNYRVYAKNLIAYSTDLNIYWLIGYLTFNNFIDKNYKV